MSEDKDDELSEDSDSGEELSEDMKVLKKELADIRKTIVDLVYKHYDVTYAEKIENLLIEGDEYWLRCFIEYEAEEKKEKEEEEAVNKKQRVEDDET